MMGRTSTSINASEVARPSPVHGSSLAPGACQDASPRTTSTERVRGGGHTATRGAARLIP